MVEDNSRRESQGGIENSNKDMFIGDILIIIGYIGGIFSFIWFIKTTFGFFPKDMLLFPLLAISIFFIYKGYQTREKVRFKIYYEFILKEQIATISHLAKKTLNSEDDVRIDIIKMINKQYFPDLNFDEENDKIIFDSNKYICQKCGAPIDKINSGVCQYCGSIIK